MDDLSSSRLVLILLSGQKLVWNWSPTNLLTYGDEYRIKVDYVSFESFNGNAYSNSFSVSPFSLNFSKNKKIYFNDSEISSSLDVRNFRDPANLLKPERSINFSGENILLLSVNNSVDNLLLWDIKNNITHDVKHSVAVITNKIEELQDKIVIVNISIEKSNWTYIEAEDLYPYADNLTVKRSDGTIVPSYMVWRENGKIYVLDDPDMFYQFIYYGVAGSGLTIGPISFEDSVWTVVLLAVCIVFAIIFILHKRKK